MSKLSKIIGRPLFEAAALPGWKNDYGKIFSYYINDKKIAARVIDYLDLAPVSATQWANSVTGITMVDYSQFSGEVKFNIGCEGVKAMKLADNAVDKATTSQDTTGPNLKALAAKKAEILKITVELKREKQMNRKVELNAKLRQLNIELANLQKAPDSVPAAFGEAKPKFNLKWIKRKDCHYAIINHTQAMAVVKALGMVENRRVSLTQYDRVTGNDSEYIHLVFRELSSEGQMYNIEARSEASRKEIEAAIDKAGDSVPASFGENINPKQKAMSRLNRVFGTVDTDPTDGMLENLNPELDPIQEDDDDLGLVQLPELPEDRVTLPESLRKELLRAAQCDSTTLALKTKHAYLSEGFISTEVAAITDVTVREAIEELGAPDYVLLKEGVYTELLIVTPLLPMAESVSAKKSRDWRQVSIEDVPHLYLKF